MDLEELQDAEQLKLAEEVDAGKISPADARIQAAQIHTQVTSESEGRRHQRAMDAAAILAATPTPQPVALLQPYQFPTPRPISCNSNAWAPGQVTTTCN